MFARLIAVASLVAAVTGQTCTCDSGYKDVSGINCGGCAMGFAGKNDTGLTSWGTEKGTDDLTWVIPSLDNVETTNEALFGTCAAVTAEACDPITTCNGAGVCTGETGKQCECFAGYAGSNCDSCDSSQTDVADQYTGWPYCKSTKCDTTATATHSCNQKGDCVDAGDHTNAANDCGNRKMGPDEKCCTWESSGFWLDGKSADLQNNGPFDNGVIGTPVHGPGFAASNREDYYSGQNSNGILDAAMHASFFSNDIMGLRNQFRSSTTNRDGIRKNVWVPTGLRQEYVVKEYETCCGWASSMACNVHQKCSEPNGLAACYQDTPGASLCRKTFSNGTARGYGIGSMPAGFQCLEFETCCDGTCCGTSEDCEDDIVDAYGGVRHGVDYEAYNNAIDDTRTEFAKDDIIKDYVSRSCTSNKLTATSAIRIGVLPPFLMIIIAVTTLLVKKGRTPPSLIFISGAATIFFNMFLLYSQSWRVAVLTSFAAWVAIMGTSAKGWQHSVLTSWFVVVTIFFTYLGGVSLFPWFIGNANQFGSLAGSSWMGQVHRAQESCYDYYGYFKKDMTHAPTLWSDSASDEYWGYCSQGWLGAVEFFKIAVLMCMTIIVGLVSKELFYVDGSTSAAVNPKVPQEIEAVSVPAEAPN